MRLIPCDMYLRYVVLIDHVCALRLLEACAKDVSMISLRQHLSGDKVTVDLTALTGLNVTSALPQALNARLIKQCLRVQPRTSNSISAKIWWITWILLTQAYPVTPCNGHKARLLHAFLGSSRQATRDTRPTFCRSCHANHGSKL